MKLQNPNTHKKNNMRVKLLAYSMRYFSYCCINFQREVGLISLTSVRFSLGVQWNRDSEHLENNVTLVPSWWVAFCQRVCIKRPSLSGWLILSIQSARSTVNYSLCILELKEEIFNLI